ncbi:MAG: hypothetical protein QOE86_1695 [Solirubrobacteraceae bacterium]|nr:hypothetical protein [Solirubrobacteraceae bacterium]
MFWVIKLVTTGIGEATSDFLGKTSIALAGVVGVLGFAVAMRMQLRARAYRAPVYWFAVLMVAVFGTMAADGLRRGAGISYGVTAAVYAVAVAAVLVVWYRSEGTLSIHSITTRRRERFYWATVLATFALGTAAGDLTALSLHLGFFGSAVLFAAVIAVPALAWWRSWINPVLAFWAAYVITRPLGASFADWFGKPHARTGLGLGDGRVTALGLVGFAALVAYVAIRKHDIQPHAHSHHEYPHGLRPLGLRTQPAES